MSIWYWIGSAVAYYGILVTMFDEESAVQAMRRNGWEDIVETFSNNSSIFIILSFIPLIRLIVVYGLFYSVFHAPENK